MSRASKALSVFLLAASSHANASAFLAKFPVALRQSYADGSYSELICPDQHLGSCSFRVGKGSRSQVYALQAGAYSSSFMPSEYLAWMYSHTELVSVAFPVACAPEDLARLPTKNELDVTCRLFLDLVGSTLQPKHVEVWTVRQDGAPAYRDLAGP